MVTVELFDRDDQTEVVLTHEGFTTDLVRSEHDQGWRECLDAIGAIATRTEAP